MNHASLFSDVRLFPSERPEGRLALQERLEGRQIARLQYAELPHGNWGYGLELTNGVRYLFWPEPDLDWASKYRFRLVYRMLNAQRIWTRSMREHFEGGREQAARKPEEPADAMQERVEGEVIVGVRPRYEPNEHGGEGILIELKGGAVLRWEAIAPSGKGMTADFRYEYIAKPLRTIFLPGESTSGGDSLIVQP